MADRVENPAGNSLRADLVMEGGGVKGMAFAGALDVLGRAGYTFPRIAGTSAGAITGALLAGLQRAGEPVSRLIEVAGTLDLSRVTDSGAVGRALGPLHAVADAASLLFQGGLYEGTYLRSWLTGTLADLGVRTFGDLRCVDPGSALPPEREYSLVVVTSDLSSRRMSLLPWDYEHYGLPADEQPVADAVCASAAVPVLFEPVKLAGRRGTVSLADGGLLSNYPIDLFDQPDRSKARWPTIGIRLSARETTPAVTDSIDNVLELSGALIRTALQGIDRRHIDDPLTVARTMFVDTAGIDSFNFELTPELSERLTELGRLAAQKFLEKKQGALWANPGDPLQD